MALARQDNPRQNGELLRAGFHCPRNDIVLLIVFSLLVASCSTSTPQPSTPQVVSVYSTAAAQPWLSDLYNCAAQHGNPALSRVGDASAADIALRVGAPAVLSSPAYQIDKEEILIVTQRQSPLQNLTLDQARALFAGQGDPSVQVWVYASGEDVQDVFEQAVMNGGAVFSSAKVAIDPQQMSDTLVNQPDTVGILPRHWRAGDSRIVFSVGMAPVLALTKSEPQGVIKELIGCLQK